MKIVCKKSDLLNGVQIVSKAVPNKTTMSILECILLDVRENEIKLIANDMEIGIETVIEGTIIEKGMIALDAKLLLEIVRKLPESDINIETDSSYKTTIKCEKAKFNIIGKAGDDFSFLPVVKRKESVILSQFSLREVIRQTIFSTVDNETNKLMSGELFEINDDNLRVASLDGHRISIRNIKLKNKYENKKVVVPSKTLNEISKIIGGSAEDYVHIFFTDNHILFEFDKTIVVSRLIEGDYFKIDTMISNDYETKVSINKKELLDCIDRSTLLVKEGDKKPIIITISEKKMTLKMRSIVGSMDDEIEINKTGKDLMIGFNPKFLIDALRVIDEETIDIYMVNPKAPCFIKDEAGSYIYLILPINFSNVD